MSRFCDECGGELIEPTFTTRRGKKICFPCAKLHKEADPNRKHEGAKCQTSRPRSRDRMT